MAQTYDEARYFAPIRSPEEGLSKINAERKRKATLAAVLFAVATVLTLGITFLMYSDAPAPENPANSQPAVLEPYR